jgi:hypothetical protein
MLDAWDEEARKYREAGSGGLHTKERCEEMKAKAKTVQGEKNHNDHGNELSSSIKTQLVTASTNDYLDHTIAQPQKLKLKVLTSTEAEGLSLLYNTFGESHNIRFSQYQIAGSLYTIAVFFEEIKQ